MERLGRYVVIAGKMDARVPAKDPFVTIQSILEISLFYCKFLEIKVRYWFRRLQ
jgi:hypothetical protein